MHLGLLFIQQPHQLVVLFNRLQRLNKHRLPARARTMHHAADLALELRLHWNHKPFAANSNQRILRTARFRKLRQRTPQAVFNRTMLPLHRPANPSQLRRRIIAQASIGFNLPTQKPQQISQIMRQQRSRKLLHRRPLPIHRSRRRKHRLPPRFHFFSMAQRRQQLRRFQRRAVNPSLVQQLRCIDDAAKIKPRTRHHQPAHLRRPLLLLLDPSKLA